MRLMSHVVFTIPLLKGNPPPEIMERWAQGLGSKAKFIYQHIKAKIPDETSYRQRIAAASSREYRRCVNPEFISRGGKSKDIILVNQAAKLAGAYRRYRSKLEHAYRQAGGKAFAEQVELTKTNYGRGMILWSLPFTGTRLNPGPVVRAGLWLTGEMKVNQYLAGTQLQRGGPVLITKPYLCHPFRAALVPYLVQTGASILQSNFDRQIIHQQNDFINQLVQNFVDRSLKLIPFKVGGPSRVDYRVKSTGFYLEIKVSRKS